MATTEMTRAIDILCSWAIVNDVNLEIDFRPDIAAGIIRRSDILEDKTIHYMVVVHITYGNSHQRIIFDPAVLHLYNESLDVIRQSFDSVVEKVKEAEKERKK